MENDDLIKHLESFWEVEDGFFWKLRQGVFDEDQYHEFLELLTSLSFKKEECIDRKIISLLWYIPVFMQWQVERITKTISVAEYSNSRTLIQNELERILGTP